MDQTINYHLVSLGCAKNRVDSENIMGLLQEKGYRFTPDPALAHAIIVNTCAFIGPARRESVEEILALAEYKKTGCRALVVAGCMPALYREELGREIPQVDGMVGPASLHRIAGILKDCLEGKKSYCLEDRSGPPPSLPRFLTGPPHSRYLKIADGCSHHCTFCVIPRLRGDYRSRPLESLIREGEILAASGAREINLVAQDTTRYGIDLYGEKKLPQLLAQLARVKGIRWIRVLYGHPLHVDRELLECMKQEEKVCNYLDLPLQHGSPEILKGMGRGKSQGEAILKMCRQAIPGIVLRSTFIVGFPGERSRHFQELLHFLRRNRIERVGIFKYSPEEGTPAARLAPRVPSRVKGFRYHRAMTGLREMSLAFNRSLTGKEVQVMVEGRNRDGMYTGRYYGQAPQVDGMVRFRSERDLSPGDLVGIRITKALEYDLEGEESP